jgi:hypothetical protein
MPTWDECDNLITRLRILPEPGISEVPSMELCRTAREMLRLRRQDGHLPPEKIEASPSGEIRMDWFGAEHVVAFIEKPGIVDWTTASKPSPEAEWQHKFWVQTVAY